MALARARRGDSGMNYWPGFVDALSTLILGIIFLLTVFVVVQFYLQQEVAGKDTALGRLNAQIAQLTELLSARCPSSPARSRAKRESPRVRWRRSKCSINKSRPCADSWRRWSRRSTLRKRRTRIPRAVSPSSDSGST